MSLTESDVAMIHAIIADAFQSLQGKKATGLNLGNEWTISMAAPDQETQGRLDEPSIDREVTSVFVPLPRPGIMEEEPGVEELFPIPPEGPPDKDRPVPPLSQVWVGRVLVVHDAAVDGETGAYQTIQVQRIHAYYETNNEPTGYDMPGPPRDLTGAVVTAWPFPMRHDQQKYAAAVGDIVSVFIGNDGRHWWMRDDLPFAAKVIADGGSTWEDNAGGAGLLSLSVRRQALSGDPSSAPATFGDLQDAVGADIEYSYVLAVGPATQQHGYRVEDKVWVERRGLYYFVTSGRESFVGYLVTLGPNGEADLTGANYWVREAQADVSYATNAYSVVYSDMSRTGGATAMEGRWVQAVNQLDAAGTHDLPTVVAGNPTTGYMVLVHLHADPVSGEPWYTFSVAPYMPDGVAGDILYHDGSSWQLLNKATDTDVLTLATGLPSWQTAFAMPSGTQGDILWYDSGAWVVLGVGSQGDVFVVGAANTVEWETPLDCAP